jgi:hypothetical protein
MFGLAIFILICSLVYEHYDNKVLYPKRKADYDKRKREMGLK